MQILGLLGMYFDAVVVEVKTFLLLFRLALAILWVMRWNQYEVGFCCSYDSVFSQDFPLILSKHGNNFQLRKKTSNLKLFSWPHTCKCFKALKWSSPLKKIKTCTANIFEVIFTVFSCVRLSTVISLYGLHLIAAPSTTE